MRRKYAEEEKEGKSLVDAQGVEFEFSLPLFM